MPTKFKFAGILVVAVLALWYVFGHHQADPQTVDPQTAEDWKKAEDTHDLGDYPAEIAALDSIVQRAPNWAALYHRAQAKRLQTEKDHDPRGYDAALSDATAAIALDPAQWLPYAERGLIADDQHRPDAALPDLDRAIRDAVPENGKSELSLAYNARAQILFGKNQAGKALADDDAALKLYPGNIALRVSRTFHLAATGQADQARSELDGVIHDNPTGILGYIAFKQRGDIWLKQREADNAIADYTKALQFGPNDTDSSQPQGGAYRNRGDAWLLKNDSAKAIADFKSALRVAPGDKTAQTRLDHEQAASPLESPNVFHIPAWMETDNRTLPPVRPLRPLTELLHNQPSELAAVPLFAERLRQITDGTPTPATTPKPPTPTPAPTPPPTPIPAVRSTPLPPGPFPSPRAEDAALLLMRFQPAMMNDTNFLRQYVFHVACTQAEQFLGGEFDEPRSPTEFLRSFRPQLDSWVAHAPSFFSLQATGALLDYDYDNRNFPIRSGLQGDVPAAHFGPVTMNPFSQGGTFNTGAKTGAMTWPLDRITQSNCRRGQAMTRQTPAAEARGHVWIQVPEGDRWYTIRMDRDVSALRVPQPAEQAAGFVTRGGRNLSLTVVFEITGVLSVSGQVVVLNGHVREYQVVSAIHREMVMADYQFP